jgi:hypothetical protein
MTIQLKYVVAIIFGCIAANFVWVFFTGGSYEPAFKQSFTITKRESLRLLSVG